MRPRSFNNREAEIEKCDRIHNVLDDVAGYDRIESAQLVLQDHVERTVCPKAVDLLDSRRARRWEAYGIWRGAPGRSM